MKSIVNKFHIISFLIFLFVSLALHYANNSSSGVLGKDESLYIFLAKGHYSYTHIDTPQGSWVDAIIKGMTRTGDPPGFFLMLHFWEQISYSETWLRLLPYIFFMICIITLIRIGMLINLPFFFSVTLSFLPLASYSMSIHAMELRGYGLELCFTYLIIYFALKIIIMFNEENSPGKAQWIILTLITIIGLSSRFSFIITATSVYCTLWLCILLRRKEQYIKRSQLQLAVSSFCSAIFFLLFFGLRYYFAIKDKINSVASDLYMFAIPGSFNDKIVYLLKNLGDIPFVLFAGSGILASSFFIITKVLIFGAGVLIVYHIYHNLIRVDARVKINQDSYLYYGLFVPPMLAVFVSILLALVGIHPFSIRSRWSLYLQPFFHIIIFGVLKLLRYNDGGINNNENLTIYNNNHVSLFFITGALALIYGSLYLNYTVTFRTGGRQLTDRVIQNMISDDELKNVKYWYISVGEANSFKYHVLYGNLRNKLFPKAKIIIENRPAAIKKVSSTEFEAIRSSAVKGSKIAMVLGHVDEKKAEEYKKHIIKNFDNVKFGELEISNQQVCYAVK